MYKLISKFIKDEKGQGLAEYGLIVAIISIVAIAAMMNIGETNNNTITAISNTMP